MGFPVGASVTVEQLEQDPYPVLARLQTDEPVSWVPALGSWLITGRAEAVRVMTDPDRFTVNDDRFTTAQVLGDSMLNMDGPEHQRHRSAFAEFFRPKAIREGFDEWLSDEAHRLLAPLDRQDHVELRSALAGPLAVNTITRFLGLKDVDSSEVLQWYTHISDSIVGLATGSPVSDDGRRAVETIHARVAQTLADRGHPSLIRTIHEQGVLEPGEVAPATAVVMFGAIETSEGMTANALWHLLKHPEVLEPVRSNRSLVPLAINESLRLEPAAAVVDRYTTEPVRIGDEEIPAGDQVSVSLLAANRDPAFFPEPDRFDLSRPNLAQYVTFAEGPHKCLGLHLAKAETAAAINAVLDRFPDLTLDPDRTDPHTGLIFRKPARLTAVPRR